MHKFSEFRQLFDEHFFSFLDSQQKHYDHLLPHENLKKYFQTIRTAAEGGKRIRPYIAWICSNKNIEDLNVSEWNILTAIEVTHLFALIHDDLMDNSPIRRGVPTSHAAITSTKSKQGHSGDVVFGGRMLAMLVGDIVFWSASTLIMRGVSELGTSKTKDIHECFTLLINGVILGQALDFDQAFRGHVSLSEIHLKTLHKTSHYTFSYPMQIGSLLNNESKETLELLFAIGEKIGFGFQIQDDILDITGEPGQIQKPIMNDIRNGQHTIITAYIKEEGTEEEKNTLRQNWRKKLDDNSIKKIQQMFIKSGAIDHAKSSANASYEKAIEMISKGDLREDVKINLTGIINYLKERDR